MTMTPTHESTNVEPISIDWLLSLKMDDIGHIGPVARTFALQNAAEIAEGNYESVRSFVYDQMDRADRQAMARGGFGSLAPLHERLERHPDVVEAKAKADEARKTAREAQDEVGGIVFCVADDKLRYAHERIDALSRKAAKIGSETLSLTDTDETVLLNYCYTQNDGHGYYGDFLHTFVILKGTTPKIPGFEFLATVNTTEAGNIIKRIPTIRFQVSGSGRNMTDEMAQEKLDSIDLDRFRYTGSICEHCGYKRERNDTFIVYSEETSEVKQVGRQCLKDFTGINNPERIMKVLQQVWEAVRSFSEKGETPSVLTRDFLAHCALMVRREGRYVSARDYDGSTRMMAEVNYWNKRDERKDKHGKPLWIDPEQQDVDMVTTVRSWALNDWDETSEFAHNVKVAVAPDVIDPKAFGMAAAVFAAFTRFKDQQAKREASTEREFVGTEGERSRGVTVTVDQIMWVQGYMDTVPLFTLKTPEGNVIRSKASNMPRVKDTRDEPVIGGAYVVDFTVNATTDYYSGHVDHPEYGKTTNVKRLTFQKTVSAPND